MGDMLELFYLLILLPDDEDELLLFLVVGVLELSDDGVEFVDLFSWL